MIHCQKDLGSDSLNNFDKKDSRAPERKKDKRETGKLDEQTKFYGERSEKRGSE